MVVPSGTWTWRFWGRKATVTAIGVCSVQCNFTRGSGLAGDAGPLCGHTIPQV